MIIYDDLIPGIAFFAIFAMMVGMWILDNQAQRAKAHANWRRERRIK